MKAHHRTDDHAVSIGSVELLAGTVVLLIIVLGSAYSVLKKRTVFPFAHYSMYSNLHTEDFQYPRMYGLAKHTGPSGGVSEVDISDQRFWGVQMHIGRKVIATDRLLNREDVDPEDIRIAMDFLRDLYNRRQRAALHEGPPIVQLRMYRHYWQLRSDLSTRDAPYQRTLMAESSVLE